MHLSQEVIDNKPKQPGPKLDSFQLFIYAPWVHSCSS